MPRLFGFTPTNKMIEEEAKLLVQKTVFNSEVVVDVIHDGPIMETIPVPIAEHVVSVQLPTYTKPIKKTLPPVVMPLKKRPSSDLKRKVSLNPLSN